MIFAIFTILDFSSTNYRFLTTQMISIIGVGMLDICSRAVP